MQVFFTGWIASGGGGGGDHMGVGVGWTMVGPKVPLHRDLGTRALWSGPYVHHLKFDLADKK